jgi:MoaA/NifB/PqqE/SkfB family radical SAM enzyme
MERIEEFHRLFPALFIAVPGHEKSVGGCLAAGRGFIHITAEGNVEPCPFAPFSDANVVNMSLKRALGSDLLLTLRQHPEKLRVTPGGCCLWKQREWVQSLLP